MTICPPMIFGPPRDPACASFSGADGPRVGKGNAPVRSLLVSDVRDVALAHLNAAVRSTEGLAGARKRLIVGLERRSSAESEADAVRRGLMRLRERTGDEMPSSLQGACAVEEEARVAPSLSATRRWTRPRRCGIRSACAAGRPRRHSRTWWLPSTSQNEGGGRMQSAVRID